MNVNEPPIFNEASDGRTTVYIAENTPDGNTNVFNTAANATAATPDPASDNGTGVTYVATDDDGTTDDSVVAYSLEPSSQTDFAIDGTSGQLSKVGTVAVDYETKSSYSLTVIATTTRGTGDR